MKPYALTENRSFRIDDAHPDRSQQTESEQDENPETRYPRELSKQGLLVSLGISVAVVGLLVFAIV